MRRLHPLLAAGVALLLLTSCSEGDSGGTGAASGSDPSAAAGSARATGTTSASAGRAEGLPRPDHVVVAIFENEDFSAVVGSAEAPYLTQLAASGAHFTDAHGVTHPSQPNYLALFSGNTQGVPDDRCPVELNEDNLAAQLIAAGETFTGYSEGLPEAGFTGCRNGRYARKHNPWVDFPKLPPSVNQPFTAMPADYARLPTVAFVVPDLCNDMHNCGVAAGDAWARAHLAPYVAWAKAHDSLLIVTFDEDSGGPENHIATIVAGADVRTTSSDQRIDHYSVLRTLEDMYGLPPLGQASLAEPLTGIWATP
jgi:acid phosphatase